jgi:hypothetical protein
MKRYKSMYLTSFSTFEIYCKQRSKMWIIHLQLLRSAQKWKSGTVWICSSSEQFATLGFVSLLEGFMLFSADEIRINSCQLNGNQKGPLQDRLAEFELL